MKIKVKFVGESWFERKGEIEEIFVKAIEVPGTGYISIIPGWEIEQVKDEPKPNTMQVETYQPMTPKDFFGQEIKSIEFK